MKSFSFKTPEAAAKRLNAVRSRMEAFGPIILGTLSKRTQTHMRKDGTKRTGPATSSLKLAGTGNMVTMRIPRKCEKLVEKMVADGKKWLELDKEFRVLTSYLAALGALKKTARDADSEVRESHGDSGSGKRGRNRGLRPGTWGQAIGNGGG